MFITFEGPDGSGKTTQLGYFEQTLAENGVNYIRLREPGGTEISEQIRDVLHSMSNLEMHSNTEVLLYQAARAQVVHQVIKPALADGKLVLCDRFFDSTVAYQGFGHGIDIKKLMQIIDFATDGLVPDITIYLDINAEEGLRRRQIDHDAEWNRLDAMGLEFHKRVEEGYRWLRETNPERIFSVNGNQSVEKVFKDINAILVPRLIQAGFLEGHAVKKERGN